MFGGDDEDGDFLSPTGGAKLASLFGLDQEGSQGNESFQYTAPKQPRKSSNSAPATQKPAPPPGAPAVLFATAVQAFRYINGQYVKQGKLGAAILGNHTTKEYKLLLYLSQQKQVTTAKIHVGFVFTVQPNNYCTFYDDQRQNWSLMFESEKASSDFCKELCLAKANSVVSLDAVLIQDLSLGEGQAVENGDSLEVVYTGWLLQNHTIGQMFDSNQSKDKLLRLKIGVGKVIKGWEEGMLGMKKAGRRLIVIPPNQAYGSKGVPNRVPANSTLIFEAELRRVKFSKDSGSVSASTSSRDSAAPSPVPSPASSVENLAPEPPIQTTTSGPGRPGEPPLRAKSDSLSEQLANPDATKAKLISRMAKMGQPMLPFLTGVASQPESSDSELEDTSGSRAKDRPAAPSPVQISAAALASAHIHPHLHTAPPSALLPVMTTVAPQPGLSGSSHAFQPYSYTQTSVAPSQLQPVGQVFPTQTVPYIGSSDVTSFLMTEARQHNTEIRLAVGKVADKVDQLASKIDDLQRQGNLSVNVPSLSMETSMIMHNIQRIVQENECLKKEVFEKSSRIEEQNRKIGELINQNQRYMEQSNLLLEQRNDSLKTSSEQNQARLLQAEQDKHTLPQDLGFGQVRLTEDLALSTAQLSELQLKATAHQQKAIELQSKLSSVLQDSERQCQRIVAMEPQLEELKEEAERAQAQYHSEKQRRKELELRVNNMEEGLQDLQTDKESLERFMALKQSRELEEQTLLQHHRQTEELQVLQEKHTALEQQDAAVREKLERRVAELEKKLAEQQSSGNTSAEVKRVMNGVFHSLRGEFDLSESYSGQAVLGVIVTTIKNVTLQLLSGTDSSSLRSSVKEEEAEEEEEEETDDVKQRQETVQSAHVNGDREVKEEEKEGEEHKAYSDSHKVSETQIDEGVAAEKETETVTKTQSQVEALEDTDLNPVSPSELKVEKTAKSEEEQEQAGCSFPEISPEEKDTNRSADPDDKPDESSSTQDAQETVSERNAAVSSEVETESVDDGEHVGEMHAACQKAFGPPANPPPPPNALPNSSGKDTSLAGAMGEVNGEEPFFQITTPVKPPTAPSEEEEEDEMSLKGRPPPAPLFGDDDEDDLDWLN
ncbi:FK506-binding protein 15 isoform X4 [Epinephelus moara]|uniref:FK506-binding protein 15 isoform X4 n=1 Tax=Epinephelus moara TaxID=300413 RepID=UPI00214F3891|nr:FK506-binding protein 15 isoform X4 [Epinephelus moara]